MLSKIDYYNVLSINIVVNTNLLYQKVRILKYPVKLDLYENAQVLRQNLCINEIVDKKTETWSA
jgi:hypothetical protein